MKAINALAEPDAHPPRGSSPERTALALFATIGVLGVVGIFALEGRTEAHPMFRWFNLDRELNVVTLFSSGLLIWNGVLTARLIRIRELRGATPRILAGLFVFMGFDESLKFHETTEKLLGIDWQVAYCPLILLAGVGWMRFWWEGRSGIRWSWSLGAAAWVVSQVFEAWQWGWWWNDAKVKGYDILMVSEEVLEMAGTALFVVALLSWLRSSRAKDESAPDCV